jgi:hypothetical protein
LPANKMPECFAGTYSPSNNPNCSVITVMS